MKCFLVDDLSGEIMELDGFLINVIIGIVNGNVFLLFIFLYKKIWLWYEKYVDLLD